MKQVWGGYRAIVRRPALGRIVLARAISALGDRFTLIALFVSVFGVTGSAFAVGALVAATAVPPLVMGPWAGYAAQRWDRRWVMAITSFISAGLTVSLIWLAPVASPLTLPVVLALAFAEAFFRPAFRAAMTDLTVDAERDEINAVTEVAQEAPDLAGFILAGAVVLAAGPAVAFAIDAATFLIAGWILMGIGVQRGAAKEGPPESVMLMTTRGIQTVFASPALRPLMIANFLSSMAVGVLWALAVVIALELLRTDAFGFGMLETIMGVGKVAGGLVVASLVARIGRPWSWALGGVGIGIGMALVALSRSYALTAGLYLAVGVVNLLHAVPFWGILQRHAPKDLVGPVMAFNNGAVHLALVLGAVLGGFYSDLVGPTATLIAAGALIAAGSLYGGIMVSQAERTLAVAPATQND